MPGRPRIRLTRIHQTILLCLVLVPFCAAHEDWKYEETHADSRSFAGGGKLHVRMTVGDLHIRRGDAGKITLRYTVKSHREKNVKEARVDFEVHDNDATIEFHSPSMGNTVFEVDLEIPENTNLDVHEKVGDLTVDEITGDKDLSLGVGDIRVGNGQGRYRLVHASAGVGDVNGDEYGETTGWLGKSLKYHGEGQYELRAHVGVGDISVGGK